MTFVLVPGAGGAAWYWSRVVPLLESAGHDVVAVDLPGDDESAGPREYADIVAAAAAGAEDVVLVAQSMGDFTAPLVCQRIAVGELVLVNAMIPLTGETAGQWWGHVDSAAAQRKSAEAGGYGEFEVATYFLHDLPPDVAADVAAEASRTSGPRPTSASRKHVTSPPGRTSRSACWQAPMTGSSRPVSSAGWPRSD